MKKIGDVLPFVSKSKKGVQTLSNRHRQIIELAGTLAEQTREEADELGFMSRLLVMVNLPYRDLGAEKRVWVRRNGKISIVVAPAYDKDGLSLGIPYGTYPRLILAYLVTQAVKTNSSRIYLGKEFRDFINLIGLKKGGHQSQNVKKQLQRVLSASFSWIYETENTQSRTNIQVSHQSQLWWDSEKLDQDSLWESFIELNHHFFNEITRNAVPLDLRVLSVLKNSPLGLDLYMFIVWRVFKLNKPVFINWKSLQQQLGGQYNSLKEFSRDCRTHITRIKALRPDLNINFIKGRLCLRPSFSQSQADSPPVDKLEIK
jgi:hypothetical protein